MISAGITSIGRGFLLSYVRAWRRFAKADILSIGSRSPVIPQTRASIMESEANTRAIGKSDLMENGISLLAGAQEPAGRRAERRLRGWRAGQ